MIEELSPPIENYDYKQTPSEVVAAGDGRMKLTSVSCTLALTEVYRNPLA